MAAPKGNEYWKFRDKHGRDHKYTPEGLWDEFVDYCEWIKNEPLKEDSLFSYKGAVIHEDAKKMRAPTLKGFYTFADICQTTWENYKKNKDFVFITTRIENAMYAMKFEGAAAGFLNPNIIARDLGLVDKQSTDVNINKEKIKLLKEVFGQEETDGDE